jgi:hypothetical protein
VLSVLRLAFLALLAFAASLPLAPAADAHGSGRRFGYFVGGLAVGTSLVGPRYWGPPPWHALPPRVVYVPPPVVYSPPVVYPPVPQVIYTVPAAPVQVAPVQVVPMPMVTAPGIPAAPVVPGQQALSIEDRLRRLQSLCDQALLTVTECERRREQILAEL